MRWVIALAVLAACDDAGVKLVVDTTGDPEIAEIRLYLGLGGGKDVPLAPEGFEPTSPARDGRLFVQDVDGVVDRVTVTDPGRYAFVYRADPGTGPLTAIAVGFDVQGQPRSQAAAFDITVPTDSVAVWTLALAPATAARPSATGRQIQVWGAQAGEQTCVHAVDPAASHRIAYIVASERDQDCDGFAKDDPLECDDLFYRAHPVASAGPTCLTTTTVSPPNQNPVPVCTLGISGCVDGSTQGRDVCRTDKRYCITDETCMDCTDIDCVVSQWESAATVYDCPVLVKRDTVTGKLQPCRQPLTIPSIHPQLACPAPAPRFRSSDSPGWFSIVNAMGLQLSFTTQPTCTTTIAADLAPGAADLDGAPQRFGGLLDVTASTQNHLVLPVSFHLVEGMCTGEPALCAPSTVMVGSTQATCVDPAIPPVMPPI